MVGYKDSLLSRKLRGAMANWDLDVLLLRNIEFGVRALMWQNAGKGTKPKPIELPDKGRTSRPAASKPSGAEIAQRLRNLGLIPPAN